MSHDDSYRGALGAAQRRIESLEREVDRARAALPLAPKGTPGLVIVLAWLGGLGVAGMTVVVGIMAITAFTWRTSGELGVDHGQDYEPPPAPKPTVGASWYTASRTDPRVVADLNGDGKKDLVALFWRVPEDTPLYVAAVDRVTLESIWVAGPYPSQWAGAQTHLVVTDDHVILSDSRETLHVLDLRTGRVLGDVAYPGGANDLCVRAGSTNQLLVTRNYTSYELLDPATQTLRKVKPGERTNCQRERPDCTSNDTAMPCLQADKTAAARSKLKDFYSYESVRRDDTLLALGWRTIPELEEREPWLVVSNASNKTLRWTSSSVLPGDTLHLATRVTDELTPKAVVSFYQRSTGDFRLVARAADTGAVVWRVSVAGTQEGSFARLFVLDGDVFVFADHRVHAYDIETGTELRVSHGI